MLNSLFLVISAVVAVWTSPVVAYDYCSFGVTSTSTSTDWNILESWDQHVPSMWDTATALHFLNLTTVATNEVYTLSLQESIRIRFQPGAQLSFYPKSDTAAADCEILVNAYCDSSPCLNGGECDYFGNNLIECDCETGFEGDMCEITVASSTSADPGAWTSSSTSTVCLSAPCPYGEVCTPLAGGEYSCGESVTMIVTLTLDPVLLPDALAYIAGLASELAQNDSCALTDESDYIVTLVEEDAGVVSVEVVFSNPCGEDVSSVTTTTATIIAGQPGTDDVVVEPVLEGGGTSSGGEITSKQAQDNSITILAAAGGAAAMLIIGGGLYMMSKKNKNVNVRNVDNRGTPYNMPV